MPAYWYNMKACGDDAFLQSICADKKPYFMVYVYDEKRRELNRLLEITRDNCEINFGCTLEELEAKENRTEEEEKFLFWYHRQLPVGYGNCAMNIICHYIEKQFEGHISKIKVASDFDYNRLKVKRRCTEKHRQELYELHVQYVQMLRAFANNSEKSGGLNDNGIEQRHIMKKRFKEMAQEICPNDDERLNIILDMCYGCKNNRLFLWDTIGDLIVKRLEELENDGNE